MHWVYLTLFIISFKTIFAEDDLDSNKILLPPPPVNLDSNLRRALIKALTELEREESQKESYKDKDKFLEKASASSVSIYSNSNLISGPTPTSAYSTTEITTESQKDQNVQYNKEQIVTSASSNFANLKINEGNKNNNVPNVNSILNTEKPPSKTTTEVSLPAPSTEENEAKVEDVQFFSAPLVAAFTVHQDEQGLPKRVEPIYKPFVGDNQGLFSLSNQFDSATSTSQDSLQQEDLRKRQEQLKQLELQQKQQILLLQQKLFNSSLSLSFNNAGNLGVDNSVLTSSQNQQTSLKESHNLNNNNNIKSPVNSISVLPSLTFDPLVEAGKLPANAQILPVKPAVNFYSPFIQNTGFQQFGSVTPFLTGNAFAQHSHFQPSPLDNNRFLRQETGIGNFGNNNFYKNTNSFSIQKSLQPTPIQTESFLSNSINPSLSNSFNNKVNILNQKGNTRFFRSNAESTFSAPQNFQLPSFQNNRFHRSNLESTFNSPGDIYRVQERNQQLKQLLGFSGALQGKSLEDVHLITNVLSLNHVGNAQYDRSNRFEQRIPPSRWV